MLLSIIILSYLLEQGYENEFKKGMAYENELKLPLNDLVSNSDS